MRYQVLHGDSRELLPLIPDRVIDAMVTDPPAGIGFMNREWDSDKGGRDAWIAWLAGILRQCHRTLKPGAHALVWAIPRTSHWTAMALEDAGFEIRDVIHHLFGQGMPKSKNLGHGAGTALKPACEHWLLARKPVEGSITATQQHYGTGGLNIDACRVERAADDVPGWHQTGADGSRGFQGEETFKIRSMSASEIRGRCEGGRWPPNVLLSDPVPAFLDAQTGQRKSGKMKAGTQRANRAGYTGPMPESTGAETYGDAGGASRYFPCFGFFPKPPRGEKEAGLDDLDTAILNRVNPGGLEREPRFAPIAVKNNHPTVKGLRLMTWLCKLVCPEGGMILDPFMGSGSTGAAAIINGQRFLGIEQDARYCRIAAARIRHWEETDVSRVR